MVSRSSKKSQIKRLGWIEAVWTVESDVLMCANACMLSQKVQSSHTDLDGGVTSDLMWPQHAVKDSLSAYVRVMRLFKHTLRSS